MAVEIIGIRANGESYTIYEPTSFGDVLKAEKVLQKILGVYGTAKKEELGLLLEDMIKASVPIRYYDNKTIKHRLMRVFRRKKYEQEILEENKKKVVYLLEMALAAILFNEPHLVPIFEKVNEEAKRIRQAATKGIEEAGKGKLEDKTGIPTIEQHLRAWGAIQLRGFKIVREKDDDILSRKFYNLAVEVAGESNILFSEKFSKEANRDHVELINILEKLGEVAGCLKMTEEEVLAMYWERTKKAYRDRQSLLNIDLLKLRVKK